MIRRRPRGETTLSKATYDHKRRRYDQPSPKRREEAEKQVARESAGLRRSRQLFNKDKDAWYDEHFGKKDDRH
jgi:hypothetical protein